MYNHIRHYVKTMLVSGSGAIMMVLLTTLLTELVFGREHYFTAYLISVVIAVIYSFVLLRKRVFYSQGSRTKQFLVFSAYMALLVVVQTYTVSRLVGHYGNDWYWLIIALVIGFLSLINYIVYRYVIFR